MLRKLAYFGGLLVFVCATIFAINQTAQVVSLANTISPTLGRVVLFALLTIYAVVLLVPVALLIRLPKPVIPPMDEQSAEYRKYLRRLGARLARNPHLIGAGSLHDRASIESALRLLDAKSDEILKKTASALFVSTAVSQNGKLDALIVLAAQTRLIWQLAHIYNQRPTLRDLGWLYTNVATTILAASAIEDIDISAQISPVIHAAVGHTVVHPGSIPGVGLIMPSIDKAADVLADIVVNSLVEGAANAYLTLRVGINCQRYCSSTTALNKREARHSANIAAASMLGSIVSGSAASVIKAIALAAAKAGQSGVESAARWAGSKLNSFKAAPRD
jgi:hypothetical protein